MEGSIAGFVFRRRAILLGMSSVAWSRRGREHSPAYTHGSGVAMARKKWLRHFCSLVHHQEFGNILRRTSIVYRAQNDQVFQSTALISMH